MSNNNIDPDKIFFFVRFKEELYNNIMQYKMTLSDYVYYERQAFTSKNIIFL